jgi:hypothetical protein
LIDEIICPGKSSVKHKRHQHLDKATIGGLYIVFLAEVGFMSLANMNDSKAKTGKDPTVAGILAWLVPGLGHWYAGRRGKALLFAAVLTSTFVAGMLLGDVRNVYFSPTRLPSYGQLGAGLLALVPMVLVPANSAPTGSSDNLVPTFDVGTYYTCVAALLNLLVMLNAIRITTARLTERQVK